VNDIDDDGNAASRRDAPPPPREMPREMPRETPRGEAPAPSGKAQSAMRAQVKMFQGALDAVETTKDAIEVWTSAADLLKAMPPVTLSFFVEGWRTRTKGSEPPPIEGLDYPPPRAAQH
jgi:hypothetical protein